MLNEYTGIQPMDATLDKDVLENQEEYKRMVSAAIRSCCSGNYGAKELVKELIRSYLVRSIGMSEQNLYELLPVREPEKLTDRQVFELLLYLMDQEGEQGFLRLWQATDWEQGKESMVLTGEMLRRQYERQREMPEYGDLLMVLSQLLFADTVGLGVIDTINQQKGCIEEIQIGMAGEAEQGYNYREEMFGDNAGRIYAKDGIHVLVHGKTIWLRFLSFGTEEELQRVLRNLVKDSRAGELTRRHPMIVADTIDGRRVSVSRPPMTDSWVGLIRKFDTLTGVTFESLYAHLPEGAVLIQLLRFLVQSGRNIAITGEMASGKTTLFRACLKETKKEHNIRVIEAESFELNVRKFLPERNTMTMRVSEMTPAEEVLAFARKTTGQIFAVGEISSAAVSVMAMDLAKIATQLFFSAHYISTQQMIADFVNAKLCKGGYSEERLAGTDVVRSLGFDIHLQNRFGRRVIDYINEVVTEDTTGGEYEIKTIYRFNEQQNRGRLLCVPSRQTMQRAEREMQEDEFTSFLSFFEKAVEYET